MSVNIRYPNITGLTDKEQLAQVKSYLHQLVEQLNYALPTLGTGDGTVSSQAIEVQGGEMSYYELRSLLISTSESLQKKYNELYETLDDDYVTKETFNAYKDSIPTIEVYVTEVGTANGWSYKKWSNGTYEMDGMFTVSHSGGPSEIGNMYYSEEFLQQTPFPVSSAIVSGTANDFFMVTNAGVSGMDAKNNIGFVLLRPDSFYGGTQTTVSLRVTGTYI